MVQGKLFGGQFVQCVFLIAIFALSASAARAQAFYPAANISAGVVSQYGQQIAVDPAGNVDVAWTGGSSCCSLYFSHSTNGGAAFTNPVSLAANTASGSYPGMTLDSSGNIYLVWSVTTGLSFSGLNFTRSSDGVNFSAPVSISAYNAVNPQVLVDPSGRIDLAWVAQTGQTQFTAYFSSSTNGGSSFSAPVAIFTANNGSGNPVGAFVQEAADASGNIYILGQDGAGQFVLVARSTNGGATFSATDLPKPSGPAYANQSQMALDAAGNINVVWSNWMGSAYHVLFSRSTDSGSTFSAPQDLTPASSAANAPKIALDSSGNIDLAWLDATPGYNAVYFARSTDGGAAFSAPKALSTDASGYNDERFSIGLGVAKNGNIEAAWEDHDSSSQSQWDVFSSESQDGGATFSAPANVSKSTGISYGPAIALDSSANAYLVWMNAPSASSTSQLYFSRGIGLSAITLNPASVTGGGSSTGTVSLSGPAPAGGEAISLASGSASASVPSSVTVAAGSASAIFGVSTAPVATATQAAISASWNGATRSATLSIAPPALTSISLNPTAVTGGASSTGTVTLSGSAPAAGAVVSLSSSNASAATPPARVTVPAGATSANFIVTTAQVSSTATASISASYNSATLSAPLTINASATDPPVKLTSLSLNQSTIRGMGFVTGTLALSGPAPQGGVLVSLSNTDPRGIIMQTQIIIPAGRSTAQFSAVAMPVPSQLTVAISASYNGVTESAKLTVTPLRPIPLIARRFF